MKKFIFTKDYLHYKKGEIIKVENANELLLEWKKKKIVNEILETPKTKEPKIKITTKETKKKKS